eukprot:1312187-Pleurochrysis_carterae.AAC.2
MQNSVSPCLCGLTLPSAYCPGRPPAVCCVCHAHEALPALAYGLQQPTLAPSFPRHDHLPQLAEGHVNAATGANARTA